jgi:hypothetical protein
MSKPIIPRGKGDDRRTELLRVRLTREEMFWLKRRAAEQSLSLSDLARKRIGGLTRTGQFDTKTTPHLAEMLWLEQEAAREAQRANFERSMAQMVERARQ